MPVIFHKNVMYAGGSGGSGGASAISDLTDVELTDLADGQILKYDATNQVWVNDDESGSGTTVIANPSGTPTEELETIQIGEDIFEIVGGGGGSGGSYEETTLFDTGVTTNGEFSLSDDINNYDVITIYGTWSASNVNGEMPITISVKDFVSNFSYTASPSTATPHLFFHLYGSEYFRIARGSDDTKLYLFDNHNGKVARVYGIKFGSGGGESKDKYSTEETVVGEWIDGKPVYQTTYEVNLVQSGRSWVNTGIVISDIKSIISVVVNGIDRTSGVNNCPASTTALLNRYNNSNLQVYIPEQWYLTIQNITVKYTKTTD